MSRPKGSGSERDSGVATALSASISLAIVAVLSLVWQLGSATISRQRAEGAADLAALAAAAYAPWGAESACERAEWVVRSMSAAVVSCRLHGSDALVEVRAPPTGIPPLATEARARAGPAEHVR